MVKSKSFRKKLINLFISVCFLLLVPLVYADPNGHYQEVGDVVYRDIDIIFDQHPGIYRGYFLGQPNDDINHLLIEHGPEGVQTNTLHDFVHKLGTYHGAFIPEPMNGGARDAIVTRAVQIGQFPYPSPRGMQEKYLLIGMT